MLHFRRAAERHHVRIGLALQLRIGGKLVQLLEFRIAQHEVVVGIPEHESLRDRLDGVVQARVGLGGLLLQPALLGHVHRDADEMARRIVGIVHQLGAGAQPHPIARDAADAEFVIDERRAGGGQLLGQREEILILGMDHRVHFAEGEELVLALVAEQFVHGIGPVDPPAADIPVPQAAASAVEGGIDPVAHLLADFVGSARAVRLHHVGDADAEQHDDGRTEKRDMADGARPPARQNMRHRLHERDLAGGCMKRTDGRHALAAAGKLDRHDAGAVREQHQGLGLAQDVGELRRRVIERRIDREDRSGLTDEHQAAPLRQCAWRHVLRQTLEQGHGVGAIGGSRRRAELCS